MTYKKLMTFMVLLLVAVVAGAQSCPDSNHPHAIDLGLPSGTKWACCNVGASKPEGYGGYYAWGETSEKSSYSLDNYKWYDNSKKEYTKYFRHDLGNHTISTDPLDFSDDAAYVNWGSSWCMPDELNQLELLNHSTHKWTTLNGVCGLLITSKKNSKSIFFPCSGRYYRSFIEKGQYGRYWFANISYSDAEAWSMEFSTEKFVNSVYGGSGRALRYQGYSVRPIENSSDSGIGINSMNFPDANFRSYIQSLFSGYSSISSSQIRSITEINVNNRNISSLVGIEHFTSLLRLDCENNRLTTLNLTKNTSLVYVNCRNNNLTSFSLPKSIVTVLCSYNKLTSLNISSLSNLNEIYCDNNNLTSLTVNGNSSVVGIHCYKNRLTTIDLSGCTNLSWLACCCNQISGQGAASLVSSLPYMPYGKIDFYHTSDSSEGNSMTADQVAIANGRGWTLYQLYNNYYYSLTGGSQTVYSGVSPKYNITINRPQQGGTVTSEKTTANAGEEVKLKIEEDSGYLINSISIRDNKGNDIVYTTSSDRFYAYVWFTMPASDVTITVTFIENVAELDTGKRVKDWFPDYNLQNYILSLDIGQDGYLTDDEIASVTTLDISNLGISNLSGIEIFTSLQVLYCYSNKITSIDLSKLKQLRELYIYGNLLTSLNVSYCTRLTTLWCHNNRLTSLVITGCTSLKILYCYLNQLRGQAMITLINALSKITGGKLYIISSDSNEGNSLDGVDTSGVGNLGWTLYDDKGNAYSPKIYVTDIAIDMGGGFMLSKGGTSVFMLGEKEQFNAVVSPSNATDKTVSWTSSAPNIVSVSNGYLEAKAVGQSTITCRANDGSGVSTYFYVDVQNPEDNYYKITINNSQHGRVTCDKTTAKAGEEITLDIAEDDGYGFDIVILDKDGREVDYTIGGGKQYLGGSGHSPYYATFTMPASDVTVTATFSQSTVSLGIGINAANFPDENFRNYLLSQDYGKDGSLSENDRGTIYELNVSGKRINSLKGIEHFTALKKLYCQNNQLAELDVSKNTALTLLYCYNNQLTILDVTKNTALTDLVCYSNQLTALDVSKNTALIDFVCSSNKLTALNVSKNTLLTHLSCYENQLTSLDVSKNRALTEFSCRDNILSALNVSNNTALTDLSCDGNQLTALDVSKNTALTWLSCYSNQIKGSAMDNLVNGLNSFTGKNKYFFVIKLDNSEGNVCTKSQVTKATNKGWTVYHSGWSTYEGSEDTPTEKLTLSANPSGGSVDSGTKVYLTASVNGTTVSEANIYYTLNGNTPSTSSTKYTTSGVSITADCTLKAIAYKDGYETSDVLTASYTVKSASPSGIAINATNFPDEVFRKYVMDWYGEDGVLTQDEIDNCLDLYLYQMDISNLKGVEFFSALRVLGCSFNKLSSLDLTYNEELTEVLCTDNLLTSIKLPHNSKIVSLDCARNRLSSLDVSKQIRLQMLNCSSNSLTSLDVSKLINLQELDCSMNSLTMLNLQNNTLLTMLYCFNNMIKGSNMDNLISTLPDIYDEYIYDGVIHLYSTQEGEGNICTYSQALMAKNKGWLVYYYDGTTWKPREVGEDIVEVNLENGYATFYDSQNSYVLPTGISAQVVTGVTNGKLAYKIIDTGAAHGVIPEGTAVLLVSETQEKLISLHVSGSFPTYSGTNLLRGSDEATTTSGSGYHYKLSYGRSGSSLSNVFGWYWGAQNGGSFQIEGHKAWLVVPQTAATRGYAVEGETLGIEEIDDSQPGDDIWYDLQGRRIEKPASKGLYIKNGKKITIK